MKRLLEKKDAFAYGLTVLVLPLMSIMFSRMFEMDGFFLKFLTKYHQDRSAGNTQINLPSKCHSKRLRIATKLSRLGFPLVNIAGHDIVQGNKKLLLAFLWELMRYTILQILKTLRSHWQGKEITEEDILNWANRKVKKMGRTSQAVSFKDKNLSNGIFFLELLSAVEPRVVDWSLVTKGETEQ